MSGQESETETMDDGRPRVAVVGTGTNVDSDGNPVQAVLDLLEDRADVTRIVGDEILRGDDDSEPIREIGEQDAVIALDTAPGDNELSAVTAAIDSNPDHVVAFGAAENEFSRATVDKFFDWSLFDVALSSTDVVEHVLDEIESPGEDRADAPADSQTRGGRGGQ